MGKINSKIVWMLWCMFLASPLLDVMRYQVIISNNRGWFLNIFASIAGRMFEIILVLATATVVWWLYKAFQDKPASSTSKGELFIFLTGGMAFLITNILTHMESLNYPNYLYSHFGLRTERMAIYGMVGSVVSLIAILGLVVNRQKSVGAHPKKYLEKSNIFGIFVYVGLAALMVGSINTFANLPYFKNLAKLDYVDKFGDEYWYINYLKENTKPDETIILPKQSGEWPVLGNQPVVRYFLFPRTLYSSGVLTEKERPNTAYFLKIERKDVTWPMLSEVADCIIFYEPKGCLQYKKLEVVKFANMMSLYKISFQ